MDFSAMVLSMYVDALDERSADERILQAAIDQSLVAGGLGFNPWYTEHHFRGPWHSAPIQFASYIAPQLPEGRRLGFGVVSVPHHHPLRLVEQMNLLDQLTHGRTLFGLGSGWAGMEPAGAGLDEDYHSSGQAARESLEVMERLWAYETGDDPYEFQTGAWQGRVIKRVAPSAYRRIRPTIIRTASSEPATLEAARRGWPAFLGRVGGDLATHVRLYRDALEQAGHAPEVVDECLRWSTADWRVIVVERDEEIPRLLELARTERMELRQRFLEQAPGPVLDGALAQRGGGREPSSRAQFARGGDMSRVIAGTPEAIAERIQQLQLLGINHLLLRFTGEWYGRTRWISERSMRLFSEQVMPEFEADEHRATVGVGAEAAGGRPLSSS